MLQHIYSKKQVHGVFVSPIYSGMVMRAPSSDSVGLQELSAKTDELQGEMDKIAAELKAQKAQDAEITTMMKACLDYNKATGKNVNCDEKVMA